MFRGRLERTAHRFDRPLIDRGDLRERQRRRPGRGVVRIERRHLRRLPREQRLERHLAHFRQPQGHFGNGDALAFEVQ